MSHAGSYGKVSRLVVAMTGASGAAITNLPGFSWLTGGAFRFRIYSSQGLDWSIIALKTNRTSFHAF
jgi:phosphatidylglycerol lysyltransferase